MPDRNGYIGRAPSDSAVTVARQSFNVSGVTTDFTFSSGYVPGYFDIYINGVKMIEGSDYTCLLYTSPSPRDYAASRMPSSA